MRARRVGAAAGYGDEEEEVDETDVIDTCGRWSVRLPPIIGGVTDSWLVWCLFLSLFCRSYLFEQLLRACLRLHATRAKDSSSIRFEGAKVDRMPL